MRLDLKPATFDTYSSAVKKYVSLRQKLGIPLPGDLTEKKLCTLCWLFCHDCKSTGLASWLSAIEDYHSRNGLPKLPRGKRFERNRKAIKNVYGQVDIRAPAVPISKAQLLRIRSHLDFDNITHAMFWLGCLLGFQGLLRASEFCNGALRWTHLSVISGGVRICVPYSKTKLTPHLVSCATANDPDFCIVQAAIQVLALQNNPDRNKPVVALSYNKFNDMLKQFYELAIGNNLGISSHSLRRGGTTTLVWQGVPDTTIMAHGRWSSSAWKDYIDLSAVQQLVAARALLL